MICNSGRGIAKLGSIAALTLLAAQACGSSKSNATSRQDSGIEEATGGSTSASANTDAGTVIQCTNDAACTPFAMVCDTFVNTCVKCTGSICKNTVSQDGGGACATSGGNPCTSIPHFTGTQIIDGKGDDFCTVPPVTLNAANAGKIITYNAQPPEVVNARIAWSAAGLHAYFDVQDSSVQVVTTVDASQATNQAYQGDSIEVMVTSSNDVTGLTGTDTNSAHVVIPASGPAISTKASNNNGSSQGTAAQLPAAEYMQVATSTGYAIELQLPWPGGAAPTPGSTIRFDMALNSADSTFGGLSDMRDGQLIYHFETVANSTCQGTDLLPYCDDRVWCATTVAP